MKRWLWIFLVPFMATLLGCGKNSEELARESQRKLFVEGKSVFENEGKELADLLAGYRQSYRQVREMTAITKGTSLKKGTTELVL